ncbi:hypothetical protein EDM54_02435 [Brevibacillus borstelensis]|uniref:hypothetical protein n=1 Tax=Brevibacillus borstelensis TaxID=45462 RepID=UPI000F085980|nr:hypothetical protein [Brevibacillus borstelensis]MED1881244.1 hypothetical protein [Brevibacillus borstelensis]RNB66109.1 hypothetical protein EDM54_02435 [Brevibacillus borstelensis]GED55436.1 hypothetical protein BBO01nite_46770 [Brevibacillus borstelensis]
MRRNRKMLLVSVLFIVLLLGVVLAKFPLQFAAIIGGVSGWLAFSIRFFYQRWESFYLIVQRIRFFFINPTTNWDMVITYKGHFSRETFEQLIKRFVGSKNEGQKILYLSPNEVEVRQNGLTLQVFYVDDQEIEIHMLNYPVAYEKAIDTLTGTITPLIESAETVIKPESKTYYLSVNFDDKNPYYGLYINKLSQNEILQFNVVFKVQNNQVDLHKNKLTISSNSMGELVNLSKDYLALSPR